MSKLLHLNPVRKSYDILSLRKMSSECEIHIRGLQNCREHAFCNDIQGAFLTIGIAEEDRDYLRFFWFPNDGDAKSYKITRMNRVPFGVTLSPFVLAAKIKFHIRNYKEDYTETYEMLNTSLYVDDLFSGSSESVNKVIDLSKNAIEILKNANMNLRKFKTNLKGLRKLWNENGIGDVCESDRKDLLLHIFCDASPRAFGAVAYLRYVTANDDIYRIFITAKSRVSPVKKLTLPQLELLGAVVASRILKYLTSKFKFPISKFFRSSDSSIAFHWIKGKASNYKQFVSNRVIEIQSNSDPSDWHHCSGREIPADYVSCGANLETIINSQFWMHGPQWLRTTENNWPKNLNCDFSSTNPCEYEEQVFTSTSGVKVTASLPAFRVELSAPFSVVGIDFGGFLYTKNENKHYIVLFTFAVTRALHLELVNNLTTETFLLALRRFISRRGLCSKILTDSAKTFKKSELELKNLWEIISDPTVKEFYASHKIYWQFITERAPWWGGFYERLIRTVKFALRKTVGRITLFRDELETLLIEIEGVLNSRLLTYIFSEFNEPEPLTPSHMNFGRRVNSLLSVRLNFD
ncbi:integrase catalytic domain-containing protein [Trichonephila clavipes]|nr:integrase catalytic domain-containing protein [Trichonephila clavipes]